MAEVVLRNSRRPDLGVFFWRVAEGRWFMRWFFRRDMGGNQWKSGEKAKGKGQKAKVERMCRWGGENLGCVARGAGLESAAMFEKVPNWLKLAIGAGVFLIGPVMVLSFWLGRDARAIVAVLSIIVYFTVIYIVGVRKYM
jgi:hypothetical protein